MKTNSISWISKHHHTSHRRSRVQLEWGDIDEIRPYTRILFFLETCKVIVNCHKHPCICNYIYVMWMSVTCVHLRNSREMKWLTQEKGSWISDDSHIKWKQLYFLLIWFLFLSIVTFVYQEIEQNCNTSLWHCQDNRFDLIIIIIALDIWMLEKIVKSIWYTNSNS